MSNEPEDASANTCVRERGGGGAMRESRCIVVVQRMYKIWAIPRYGACACAPEAACRGYPNLNDEEEESKKEGIKLLLEKQGKGVISQRGKW